MDELPGIGPARKRTLLKHFGSPEAVLAASREELERVPGFPQKVARGLYAHLNKTGQVSAIRTLRQTLRMSRDGSRAPTSRTSSSSPGSPARASRRR